MHGQVRAALAKRTSVQWQDRRSTTASGASARSTRTAIERAIFDDRREAAFQLQQRELEAEECWGGLREARTEPKAFSELADYWEKNRVPQKRSGHHDESILRRHLRPSFGAVTLGNLGWMTKVPRIRKPRVRLISQDYSYLRTDDEIARFLRSAKEEENELVFVLYAMAVYTGMREGELAGLRRSRSFFRSPPVSSEIDVLLHCCSPSRRASSTRRGRSSLAAPRT